MLIIRCSKCKEKIWRYDKIGQGEVLRCHKARIDRVFNEPLIFEHKILCPNCKTPLGIDKGSFYKMDPNAFMYKGTKRNS